MKRTIDRACLLLATVYGLDRLLRLAAIARFFRRSPPPPPPAWPAVTLLQPITRGASGLATNLALRAGLRYEGRVQHLLVCDQGDAPTLAVVRAFLAAHPALDAQLIFAHAAAGVATKIEKLLAALPCASGAVLCFVDDDVALRPDALCLLLPYLCTPQAGAAFGLACYSRWNRLGSSLMSAFVNANALPSYVPLSMLAEPFTITGHCYALSSESFALAGGFDGMAGRYDDDHELARRLRRVGLRSIQTPLIYDVANDLAGIAAYRAQLHRWMTIPRQAMLPALGRRDRLRMALAGLSTLFPPLLALLALLRRSRTAWSALAASLTLFVAGYAWCEGRYLGRRTPLRCYPLLLWTALLTPVEAMVALVAGDTITWRGRRLRAGCDGMLALPIADNR